MITSIKAFSKRFPFLWDSFGNFVILNWEFIYKGSIRDFFPPVDLVPSSPHGFQIYAESIGELSQHEQIKLVHKIGSKIESSAFADIMDFAFLCLHGSDGEDGRIQGLLEFYKIPYSGSGIISSAIGMNKAVQKELMVKAGFEVPGFLTIQRDEWFAATDKQVFLNRVKKQIGNSFVVKSANQGSSIGVSILHDDKIESFIQAVNRSFFTLELFKSEWDQLDYDQKLNRVRVISDIRDGIGIPVMINNRLFIILKSCYRY